MCIQFVSDKNYLLWRKKSVSQILAQCWEASVKNTKTKLSFKKTLVYLVKDCIANQEIKSKQDTTFLKIDER